MRCAIASTCKLFPALRAPRPKCQICHSNSHDIQMRENPFQGSIIILQVPKFLSSFTDGWSLSLSWIKPKAFAQFSTTVRRLINSSVAFIKKCTIRWWNRRRRTQIQWRKPLILSSRSLRPWAESFITILRGKTSSAKKNSETT